MPKISEERRVERREQILEGARRCFAEHGYEGATVVKLEEEIGLSRGAIFNYFSSKDDPSSSSRAATTSGSSGCGSRRAGRRRCARSSRRTPPGSASTSS
jgi:hypothetical protein